jgi:hypothetical protein
MLNGHDEFRHAHARRGDPCARAAAAVIGIGLLLVAIGIAAMPAQAVSHHDDGPAVVLPVNADDDQEFPSDDYDDHQALVQELAARVAAQAALCQQMATAPDGTWSAEEVAAARAELDRLTAELDALLALAPDLPDLT